MCWYVYIATQKPLRDVRFTEHNPSDSPHLLHFQKIKPDPDLRDNLVRPLFKAPYLYYVGSSSGCSCHLSYMRMEECSDGSVYYTWHHSCAVFLDFIQRYTRQDALEIYAVWEDAWDKGLAHQPLDASTLTMDTYFGLHSRRFYTFAGPAEPAEVPSPPRFLNVDLDVMAPDDPQVLIEHWREQFVFLVAPADTGTPFVRFECLAETTSAVETLQRFCEAAEGLPPELAEFWQRCPQRILDIGYESGSARPSLIDTLPSGLLARVTQHFTDLTITLYPLLGTEGYCEYA
jgi:hypothetical protein